MDDDQNRSRDTHLDAEARDPDDADEFARHLHAAKEGHGPSIEFLIRLVDRGLVGFLAGRRVDDPEGLANEVLLRAIHGLEGFAGSEQQFRGWVFTIARNRSVDDHRHRRRRVAARPEAPEVIERMGAAMDPESTLEERERVDELLASLTDDQRDVVLLRVVAGLSVAETAEVVGRRPGAVRALQHRALERLRGDFVDDA